MKLNRVISGAKSGPAKAGAVQHITLALAAFALTIWGFIEIGCLRGTGGTNSYDPNPLLQPKRRN
ncbi:hypothetical protein [Bradyrhizobium sp.]|uniref:hypothetical protein n=1 Tax=Bradyrhizobium sp. TaxID=376 RepID=UPI003C746C7C